MIKYSVYNTDPIKNCKWYFNRLKDMGFNVSDYWTVHSRNGCSSGFDISFSPGYSVEDMANNLKVTVIVNPSDKDIVIDDFDQSKLGFTLEDYINQLYE